MPETERMSLRRINWPDIDDVVAMNADVEVMHLDDGRAMTAAGVLAEMPGLIARNAQADPLGYWIARDRASGEFLGWFTMSPVDTSHRTVELSYRLRRRAWGKGYGIEGVLAMIEMARAAPVTTVIASTMAGNAAGRKVMEKAGLRLVRAPVADASPPSVDAEGIGVRYVLELV